MSRAGRVLAPLLAAFLCGALAWWLFGESPESAASRPPAHVDWALPTPVDTELAAADAVWKERIPWGSAPGATPSADAGPALPPPSIPVGIVADGGAFRAVFVTPGAGEVRVKAGDPLPDGGRVNAITRFSVVWTDAQGTQHEHELLADPLLAVPTDGSPEKTDTRPRKRTDGQPSAGAFSRR